MFWGETQAMPLPVRLVAGAGWSDEVASPNSSTGFILSPDFLVFDLELNVHHLYLQILENASWL